MAEQPWWRPAVAEFLGVFALVFIGAGSIIALTQVDRAVAGSQLGAVLLGVAIAHGLALATMITALGHVSGGHFNPAVTAAALFTRRIKPELGVLYIVFQILGGIFGAFLLVAATPSTWWDAPGVHLGTPAVRDGLSTAKAVLVEAVLTFFLVLVVFGTAMDERNPARRAAGFAIGLAVTMGILAGGWFTGAALNPARAFGPALLARFWDNQYVYWAGPLLGGIVAGFVYDTAYLPRVRREAVPPSEPAPAPMEPAPPPMGGA